MKTNYADIDLTQEQREKLYMAYEKALAIQIKNTYDELLEFSNAVMDVIVEFVNTIIGMIRKFGEYLGRLLFMQQLIEWRVPHRWAEIISKRLYWKWACFFGYRWLSLFCRRCVG